MSFMDSCLPPCNPSQQGFVLPQAIATIVVPVGKYNVFNTLVLLPKFTRRIMMGPGNANGPAGNQIYRSGMAISFVPIFGLNDTANPYNETGREPWIIIYNPNAPTQHFIEGMIIEVRVPVNQFYFHFMGNINTGVNAFVQSFFCADDFNVIRVPAANITG